MKIGIYRSSKWGSLSLFCAPSTETYEYYYYAINFEVHESFNLMQMSRLKWLTSADRLPGEE